MIFAVVVLHRLINFAFRFGQVIGEGAVPVIDPHQQGAAGHFMRDSAFAGPKLDAGDLGERNLCPACRW